MTRKKAGLATKIHAVDEVVAAETSGAAIADPKGLGASLKQARLARGLSLADVSASLRLRGAYLDAIENDRREALPGPVYANGYVRSYAAFLGMDPDEAVRRFKREAGDTRARPELVFPSPAPEGRVPGGAAILVGLVFLVTVYGGWYYLRQNYLLSDLALDVPARLAHLMEPAADVPAAPPPRAAPRHRRRAAPSPRPPSHPRPHRRWRPLAHPRSPPSQRRLRPPRSRQARFPARRRSTVWRSAPRRPRPRRQPWRWPPTWSIVPAPAAL